MPSKTLLITGVCTNGIGYETCKHILEVQRVARVPTKWNLILAQRDDQSHTAAKARKHLESLAQSVACSVKAYKCDLASFDSIRTFVQQIKLDVPKIDVLVLNAGAVINTRKETIDGNDMTYQVNHLGHFLLLSLLKDCIDDKVIFVGSSLHKKADASATLSSVEQVGVAQETGFIPSSGLARDNSRLAQIAMAWIIHYLPFARTLQQGGHTLAALAIGQEWSDLDGCYLDADLKIERMHEDVYNKAHAQKIWDWSNATTKSDL
ncbi:Short-chain dehydrogenase [Taphrina deformans PYCC 5710]|uniref:Short-chain dehydrogenase n=1 Tax=Taphrina deformans (strain PYCC 5710 / ATCC 11124 / CBS 356.35 / IMI 108563 / JCM 9778 / NBRC 8474) TaxID=1097556 RepID=R4X9F7_TAPDE|nr:Short-chain dehydrogenase [Taphrina deformans PYCC 5710]|eukprot:CCG82055.1 Short-chain dehydrogenase [Taphrina deformans PYCC 5710]